VSRIHDALRRGRVSVGAPHAVRAGQSDAVLSALGYRSEVGDSSPRRGVALAVLAVIAAGAAWYFWPRATDRLVAAPRPPIAASKTPSPAPPPQPISKPVTPAAVPAPATTPAVHGIQAKTQAPAKIEPPTQKARVPARDDFQLAVYYQRTGDFEQALVHYKAAIQRNELNLQAHNNLGYLYLGKGLLDEAAREFQRVIAIEPGYVTGHVNLSAALFRLGRFDGAAAQARQALALDPRNGDAFVNLALAQNASGQSADAQSSLRRALEFDARNPAAHYNLARQYEAGGEAARALDHYRQFLQYAGPDQEAYAQDVRARVQALQTRIK